MTKFPKNVKLFPGVVFPINNSFVRSSPQNRWGFICSDAVKKYFPKVDISKNAFLNIYKNPPKLPSKDYVTCFINNIYYGSLKITKHKKVKYSSLYNDFRNFLDDNKLNNIKFYLSLRNASKNTKKRGPM